MLYDVRVVYYDLLSHVSSYLRETGGWASCQNKKKENALLVVYYVLCKRQGLVACSVESR